MKNRKLISLFAFAVSGFTANAAFSMEQFDPMQNVGYKAQMLFQLADESPENFDKLDAMFEELNHSLGRTRDGRQIIPDLSNSLDMEFQVSDWDQSYRKLKQWKARSPKSVGVAISEAVYWIRYAWIARGNGYASTVTPEGWELYRERLQRAVNVLEASKDYASSNVLWYEEYLAIAVDLGWNKKQFQELYSEAVRKTPQYYPFHFTAVRYYAPKWGGSVELVDQHINNVVKLTSKEEGQSLYARLYQRFDREQGIEFDIFKNSLATWPRMKKGFEDLMLRYPESMSNLNGFAAYACRAGDKETFNKLRKQIGTKVDRYAWPVNYSIEVCDRRFFEET